MSDNEHIEAMATTLAKRAAVVRMIPPTRQKIAQTQSSDWVGTLGRMWSATPDVAKGALIGGLGGGLLGYGSQAFREEDERRPWRSALTGLLAGGALGAGAGLAYPALQRYLQERKLTGKITELEKKLAPGAVGSALGSAAGSLGPAGAAGAGLAGLYQLQRSMPESKFGPWAGRLVNPGQVMRELGMPAQAIRDAAERAGVKPGGFTTFRTPSGHPLWRRENPLLRWLGAPKYYVTGTPLSRIRGLGGTTAAFALPFILQAFGGKALPSKQRQLLEDYRRQLAELGE